MKRSINNMIPVYLQYLRHESTKVDVFIRLSRYAWSFRLEVRGVSRDIWIMWRDEVDVVVSQSKDQLCHTQLIKGTSNILVTFVNGNPQMVDRRLFCEGLPMHSPDELLETVDGWQEFQRYHLYE